jgi:hypothetical protein
VTISLKREERVMLETKQDVEKQEEDDGGNDRDSGSPPEYHEVLPLNSVFRAMVLKARKN